MQNTINQETDNFNAVDHQKLFNRALFLPIQYSKSNQV